MSQKSIEWVVAYTKMTGADGLLRIKAVNAKIARKYAEDELHVRYGKQVKYMRIKSVIPYGGYAMLAKQ